MSRVSIIILSASLVWIIIFFNKQTGVIDETGNDRGISFVSKKKCEANARLFKKINPDILDKDEDIKCIGVPWADRRKMLP